MQRQKISFSTILNEKLNEDSSEQNFNTTSHSSAPEQSFDSTPAHLAFLLGSLGKFEFASSQIKKYTRPKQKAPLIPLKLINKTSIKNESPAHRFSEIELVAFNFLKEWSTDLQPNFSKQELKKAFRVAARKIHPDMGGSGTLYQTLLLHFKRLNHLGY